jgi:hypothetical protein
VEVVVGVDLDFLQNSRKDNYFIAQIMKEYFFLFNPV